MRQNYCLGFAPSHRLFRSGKIGIYISGKKTRPERRIPEWKKSFWREVGKRKEFARDWRKYPGTGEILEMWPVRGDAQGARANAALGGASESV